MYSVVLAAMLTTQPATPQWGHHHWGCHGCHGCWGCYGGCYGCWGCYGGGWGGYGYGWGGYPWGGGWYGYGYGWPAWGGCYGGAFGCAGGGYACLGCYGCYGWGGYVAANPVLPATAPANDLRGRDMPYATAAAAPRAPAKVVVQLPADAKLYADGKAISLDDNQAFTTPKLQAGETYTYTLKVQAVRNGRLVNETKDVHVYAGETTRVSFKDMNAAPAVARGAAPEATTTHVTVKLPDNAKLYVNDVLCPARSFDTPKLEANREYSYTLKAEVIRDGQARTESKVVKFRAGAPVTVDFNAPADVRTVSR